MTPANFIAKWQGNTREMPDEEILRRLLALNLERSSANPATIHPGGVVKQ
ncbi:MAG: hypothetical protein Q8O38_05535 [Sulfurimicrobium sp.]|nr:hypothetical protein [Sulfurimicrobium sp.]